MSRVHDDGWDAFDLDGTLARHDRKTFSIDRVGEPIPEMVAIAKARIAAGRDVRIFTARVAPRDVDPMDVITGDAVVDAIDLLRIQRAVVAIQAWCLVVFGHTLPITCVKDFRMRVLWDDRAIQVETNTGRIIGDVP